MDEKYCHWADVVNSATTSTQSRFHFSLMSNYCITVKHFKLKESKIVVVIVSK